MMISIKTPMRRLSEFRITRLILFCFLSIFLCKTTVAIDLKESKRLETLFAPVANHLANIDGRWLELARDDIERFEQVLVRTTRMMMRDAFSPIFFKSGDANHFIELLYMHPNVEASTFSFLLPTQLATLSGNHFERKNRDVEATINLFVYWLDHHLFLTPEQMVEIHEIIKRKGITDMMITSNFLIYDAVEAIGLFSMILPESEIGEVLSDKQNKVWKLLYSISDSSRKSNRFISTFYNSREKEVIRSFYKTELPRDEAQKRLDAIAEARDLDLKNNKTKNNLSLTEEQKTLIASARAGIIIDQISEASNQTLPIGIEEVISNYIEETKPRSLSNFNKEANEYYKAEMDKLRKLLREKQITRQDASAKSQMLKQELRHKLSAQRKKTTDAPPGIENFPPFHELIKQSFGDEKLAALKYKLDVRVRLLNKVMKELATAYLDTHLILSETQLSFVNNSALRLPKLNQKYPSSNMMVYELVGLIKLTPLSQWQDERIKEVGKLAPFAR